MNNINDFLNSIDNYLFTDAKKNTAYFTVCRKQKIMINNTPLAKIIDTEIKKRYNFLYRYRYNSFDYTFIPNRRYYIRLQNLEWYFNYIIKK